MPGLGHAQSLIRWYDEHRPDVVALATAVALAVRVEPGLLRQARLELTPGIGVAAEGDLWFSPLVESYSVRGLVLNSAVAEVLRERLARHRHSLEAAHALVVALHEGAPPTLRLQEDLVYAALLKDAAQVTRLLETALRTVEREPVRAPGIARWADRAVPAMPAIVRDDPHAQYLAATVGWALDEPLVVGIGLTERGVVISEPPAPGVPELKVPSSSLRLQLRRLSVPEDTATVEVRRGGVVRHRFRRGGSGPADVEVKTADGRIARLGLPVTESPVTSPVTTSPRAAGGPKRLVICCDGTWDPAEQKSPTNVTKIWNALAREDAAGIEQRSFYHAGVGANPSARIRGGAFGLGLSRNVKDTYRFIVENFEPGDELFFFGFSRGAYIARSTAAFVRSSGVLRREQVDRIDQAYELYRSAHPRGEEAQLFRNSYSQETRIRFIGVWDTVGALGIPLSPARWVSFPNRRWRFHDTALNTTVDAAFQALAIDEKRPPFRPCLWSQQAGAGDQRLEQVWFAGVHGDVGGGYPDHALSDVALLWMVDRAASCGLAFNNGTFRPNPPAAPDPKGQQHETRTRFYKLVPPYVRPIGAKDAAHESVASSAVERHKADPGYAPRGLVAYLDGPHNETRV
jgi:hypothetical protein